MVKKKKMEVVFVKGESVRKTEKQTNMDRL